MVGDWDGTGRDKVGFFFPSDQTFTSESGQTMDRPNMRSRLRPPLTAIPLVGDSDGTGRNTVGFYFTSDQTLHLGMTAIVAPSV